MDETAKVSRESNTVRPFAIEIADLEKHFGSSKVLDQLSLCVEPGELLVVLGDSGCGKSTLLKLIAGLDRGQNGTIQIGGIEQTRVPPHKRDVAMVFQDGNGYEHLTVQQNLELAAKSNPNGPIPYWVDGLRLGALLKQKLAQLSGGELQRVAIARAMISGKSIVLLDEPLAHLNQSLREEIRELILNAHVQTEKTFVYVTHDSEEAFYLADRIAVLAGGKIQRIGSPRTVYLSSQTKQVARLLGQPTIDIITVPKSWLGSLDDAMIECGARSHDWTIHRIEAATKDLSTIDTQKGLPYGVTRTDTGLKVQAWIDNCSWMGGRWLIELNCPSKIRITCESPAADPIEQVLRLAATAKRERSRSMPFGLLEATIERSCLQVFTND